MNREPAHRPKPEHKGWFWFGNAANAIGVGGTIWSAVAGQPELLTFFAGAVAVGAGYWLRRRRFRTVGFVLVAAGTVAATAALSALFLSIQKPDGPKAAAATTVPTPATHRATVTAPVPIPVISTSDTPVVEEGAKPRFDGEVTLVRHAAVDVDQPGQQPATDRNGATGDFDLYHDSGQVRSDNLRTHDGVFTYPSGTSAASAYSVCLDYTSDHASYNAFTNSAAVQNSSEFCFLTSEHRLAWANVISVDPRTWTTVVAVRVWDDIVP